MNKEKTQKDINSFSAKKLFVLFIKFYQKVISPYFGKNCKHHPSCSHFGVEAIEKHGVIKGLIITTARILRCNPWSLGGYDPVPEEITVKDVKTFKLFGNYKTELYK